jgi:hypothetical protein
VKRTTPSDVTPERPPFRDLLPGAAASGPVMRYAPMVNVSAFGVTSPVFATAL